VVGRAAIGPAGGEDALPVDRVRRYLVEKAFDETGVENPDF